MSKNMNRWNATSVVKKAENCSILALFVCQINEKCLLTKEECSEINRADLESFCDIRKIV